MRPTNPYSNAHTKLRRLYDERIGDSMTQKEFARRYRIGSGAMLAMLLNGQKPLSIEAAAKLADALGSSIYEICPEMGDYIKDELLPVLGKALRRAAMVLLSVVLYQFAPSDAYASSVLHNAMEKAPFCANVMNLIHIVRLWLRKCWMCVYAPSVAECTSG